MVAAKQREQANEFNKNLKDYMESPKQYKTDLVDMYKILKNQQTLATGLGPFTGGLSFLGKPLIANKQKELEKALVVAYGSDWENNEIFKTIDDMTFMDKVNSAFSSLKEIFTTDKGDYNPKYDTASHPLGGNKTSMGSAGMLNADEQQAYDNAVSSGNVNVANHYAIINHHRAIRLEEGKLLKGDIVNLPHLANQVTTTTDNNDDDNGPSHAEIIANATANAQSIASSNTAETSGPTAAETAANREALKDSLGTGASGQMI